jgi:signal transduction histidine kinase
VLLGVLDAVAFAWLAAREHDLLQPLLITGIGQDVYDAALRRNATALALFDVPLLIAGGVAAYVLALVSVRPLVAAREREARFAAEAAHELRTPLARIAAVAQSARGASDPGERDAALASIAATAVDAAAIVGDLLTLVRDERVAPKLSEPVDVGALARAAASARDGAVARDVAASGEYWVQGDERRLRRLVDNLLDNADRHARSCVTVRVGASADSVELSVEDDGPGVPAHVRERIFERFVRASDDDRGSGLGLAICRAIAHAHGGDVVLEGRNRFVARLPRFRPG